MKHVSDQIQTDWMFCIKSVNLGPFLHKAAFDLSPHHMESPSYEEKLDVKEYILKYLQFKKKKSFYEVHDLCFPNEEFHFYALQTPWCDVSTKQLGKQTIISKTCLHSNRLSTSPTPSLPQLKLCSLLAIPFTNEKYTYLTIIVKA